MNLNNINVNKYPLSQIFDPDTRHIFEIPKYQRAYTWGKNNWEQLFDDLVENDLGYFLGSIICIDTATDAINAPKFEVVDGQQRLTTLSLFLAALYTVLSKHHEQLNDEQLTDIIQLKRKLVLKNTDSAIRVVPQVQGSNRDDYLGILSLIGIITPKRNMPSYAGVRRVVKAYDYFCGRIGAYLNDNNDTDGINSLFTILDKVNSAILVKIDVPSHSDAYTLFASLNDRGAPLTAIDLIKNMLLAHLDRAGEKDIDSHYNRWEGILKDLGEEYYEQERFFRQNYNAFRKELNLPFYKEDRLYPLGTMATRSTMLGIYEKIIKDNPVKALEKLTENASLYASIILNKEDGLTAAQRESYLDLKRIQGAPSYLLLLYLVKNHNSLQINDDEIVKVCRLLVNFFVRRNMTDIPPTRDLTRMFMSFIEEIEQNNLTGDAILARLRNKLADNSASDEVFAEKLKGPVYDDNVSATRFILCMMAKRGMTRENEQDLWKTNEKGKYFWSIEHIFPQGDNIPNPWVNMIAGGDRQKAKELQAEYVHTFGNLTITAYNSSLSNKSFQEKKERKDSDGKYIGYLNGFNLNSDVCDKDQWTVDIIKARTERMVETIVTMFALKE
ncbi:MAG: DUF262 domain-containing protein [Succinimonas sp.]|nr:DUF262 domain-containing protein [Succinimonas sp.]